MNITRSTKPKINVKDNIVEKVQPLFDIKTLDAYCRYVISTNKSIKVSGLNLIRDLFDKVDPKDYGNDVERAKRIEFIKRGLDARLKKKLSNKDMILHYINGGMMDEPLLDTRYMEEVSDEELAYLNEQAGLLSKTSFVDGYLDTLIMYGTELKNLSFGKRSDTIDLIQETISQLNMRFNKIDDSVNQTSMFSLIPGEFESSVTDTYSRETNPSRILRTGITGLNIMLDGGFESERVYIIFAQAAGGKSFTMLDLAIQIKNHNRDYIPHDPTKIPCIIFLTMENSKDENISRFMGMASGKSFNDYSLDESIGVLRNNGLGYDKDRDPIDIVMVYKPNLSVNTDYLYTLTDKLRELGREPICLFQDHIKRIRPVNRHNDLRLDLGEIVNEFKTFATVTGIPVITDSHLNREASKTLDESSSNNKKDLIRNLGSFNVSESYLMIDNCDVGIIINKEMDSHENHYLGFKIIKTRTKCDLDLMYQPYMPENKIKLVEDVDLPTPLFRRGLKEENQPITRVSRRSDFNSVINSKHATDDDELFGAEVMGGVMSQNPDDILLPDNANQSSFVVVGHPSEPVFPISPIPPKPIIPLTVEETILTDWEKELVSLKYNYDSKTAIAIFNDQGLSISDGVEDF